MERHGAVEIFSSAVASVQPAQLLPGYLSVNEGSVYISGQSFPSSSIKNIYVIGAGKAAAAMAIETENILGDNISGGLVVTKYHHSLPCKKIKIIEAAHPVPDEKGVDAVEQTMQLLERVRKDDIIICLVSGGASALWCDLPEGITLEEIQITFNALLKSGASIGEMNTVRKHLSSIKGGQLVRHCHSARLFTFMISDVPGDRLDVIASGPTMADPSTFNEAFKVLDHYNLLPVLPGSIQTHIEKGMKGMIAETPKPGDQVFDNTYNAIIGNNSLALKSAALKAASLGYHVHLINYLITGDANQEAKTFVDLALQYDGPKPVCIIQGGETTVKVTGKGKGGRNQHFALCALKELKIRGSSDNISILSAGTDGSDGPTEAAGAIADHRTLLHAEESGLLIDEYLENNDAFHFFEQTGSLIITGPTQTNVMDIMIATVK